MDSWTCCTYCLVLVGLVVLPVSCSFVCETPTKDPNEPQLPSIPGQSYSAQIELNILDKMETFSIEEYLDFVGNRAARTIWRDNSVVNYIYSYDTDEIFTVQDDTCIVVNMSSPEGQRLLIGAGFSRSNGGDGRRRASGSATTFKYARDKSDYFGGQQVVRGIPAYKWATCIPTGNATKMQVSYYFNAKEWKMQITGISLPLRIEVEGDVRNRGSPGTHYFHHYYDFINYRPFLPDPLHFQTPENVLCAGRVSTKPVPTFSKTFRYSGENIDSIYNTVLHFAIWYDGLSKLVRIDKRDVIQQAPVYTLNPVTEVHDYTLGVRYIRDNVLGNCSIHPLGTGTADATKGPQKTISMTDPSMFFQLNQDYVYSGQRTARGIVCHVFSATIPNYPIDGDTVNCTFHYYFMYGEDDLPLQDSTTNVRVYPVQLEIIGDGGIPIRKEINFFDFDDSEIFDDVFDVSDCFDRRNKLDFRVVFPGTYYPSTEYQWKHFVHYKLADVIMVPPTRIGNLAISANLHNVFVTGSILGMAYSAQFQVVTQGSAERNADKSFPEIQLQSQCADLCIENPDFLCQGYQYCPDTKSCGLSKTHVMNQAIITGSKNCGFYTRTIAKSDVKQPTLKKAFDALQTAVQNQKLNVGVQNPDGFMPNFQAISVQLLSGYPSKNKTMPVISSQFSYRVETIVPQFHLVFDAYVWYDSNLKFVRLDTRNQSPVTVTEYSMISDFNLGITYKINRVTNQCQIMPIDNKDDFVNSFASKADKDGGLKITMKSPSAVFYMDQSYTYMGQRTVRGILCDVYEAVRSDFHLKPFNRSSENSIFTLYFQAEPWRYYTANSLDVTSSQPVQLTIEDTSLQAETMLTYNFFDYNDEHHTSDYYDVSSCYSPDQTKSFQVIFKNQPYHPSLDGLEPTFKNIAILKMGEYVNVSPMHFQGVTVSHDDTNVYIMVTALGAVSPKYLFQPVNNVTLNPSTKTKTISASTYQDCAAACVDLRKPCYSFDFCPDVTNPRCLLLTTREELSTMGRINPNGKCTHYSRSVNQYFPMVQVEQMYQDITDIIYSNSFNITLVAGGKATTYFATDIRDDILRSTDPASASGSVLNQFGKMVDTKLPDSAIVETHTIVSITDCAVSCVTSTSLHCQSFDYNFAIGTCRLSNKHLDEITGPFSHASHINIYSVHFTRDYTRQDGYVFSDKPDKSVTQVSSSELCARSCNEQSDFKCESFEYCPDDKTCNLRKGHNLPTNQQHPGQTPNCLHYSREHLYDYTKRSNHFITGHDDLVVTVGSDSECARLCATGELNACASFEMCQAARGVTQCKLSQADPTLQSDLTITSSRECNLYIKSNPAPRIKPSPPQTQTTSSSQGITSPQSQTTSSSPVDAKNQISSSTSDTGTRVGIAFGTLMLGLLIGAAGMFLFEKMREKKRAINIDAQQLKEF